MDANSREEYVFRSGFVYAEEDQVRKDAKKSKTLGWSWNVVNTGVYHTGIVIFLDGKPRYSVNWGPVAGTEMFRLASSVRGQVEYGVENPEDEVTTFAEVIGSVQVGSHNEKEIDDVLDKLLLNFEELYYHQITCNCRYHVISVLESLGIDNEKLEKVKKELDNVKTKADQVFDKILHQH